MKLNIFEKSGLCRHISCKTVMTMKSNYRCVGLGIVLCDDTETSK